MDQPHGLRAVEVSTTEDPAVVRVEVFDFVSGRWVSVGEEEATRENSTLTLTVLESPG